MSKDQLQNSNEIPVHSMMAKTPYQLCTLTHQNISRKHLTTITHSATAVDITPCPD